MVTLKDVMVWVLTQASEEERAAVQATMKVVDNNVLTKHILSEVVDSEVSESEPNVSKLEKARLKAGLTRAELAELAEVSPATVWNAERNPDKVSEDTMIHLIGCVSQSKKAK